jgi:hypothetical protein
MTTAPAVRNASSQARSDRSTEILLGARSPAGEGGLNRG